MKLILVFCVAFPIVPIAIGLGIYKGFQPPEPPMTVTQQCLKSAKTLGLKGFNCDGLGEFDLTCEQGGRCGSD